ncbi:MAG: hypothetical protein Q9217_001739 [Psora testacea]
MADKAAIFIAKRLFKGHRKPGSDDEDEDTDFYYIDYADPGYAKYGNIVKKVKDESYYFKIGIPRADAKRLARIKRRARWLDAKGEVMGMKVGLSSIIGLIPAYTPSFSLHPSIYSHHHTNAVLSFLRVGDTIDGLLALSIVRSASKVSNGLDPGIRNKMMRNVILDVIIGLVPVLGDIGDTFFRCNTKNSTLLEEMLKERVKKALDEAEKTGKYRDRFEDYADEHVAPPGLPNRQKVLTSSSHESARHQHRAPESRSKSWKSEIGKQGTRKQSTRDAKYAGVQAGRFISARDL